MAQLFLHIFAMLRSWTQRQDINS